MGRRTAHRDDDDEDWDDPDGPTEFDTGDEDDEEEPQVRCPYCRAWKFEDAPQCPTCGRYVSKEDASAERKPLWILVLLGLSLVAALLMAFG